jgi:transposase InsO family protein
MQNEFALDDLSLYSLQLNGAFEPMNGAFRYEFYALQDSFKSEVDYKNQVQNFTNFYNSVRTHQSLRFLTPCQFLEKLN